MRLDAAIDVDCDTSSVLLAEGRYDLAVIVAQMACEVLVEQTVASRVKSLDPRQTFNLHAEKTRKLYNRATGDDIEKAHFWPQMVLMPSAATRQYIGVAA